MFYLMEIKNDFNQYNLKRRQAQESLDLLKWSLKSLHCSEDTTGSNTSIDLSPAGKLSPQALVLCRALYRMHFQFLVFLGSYNKLLGELFVCLFVCCCCLHFPRYRGGLEVRGWFVRHLRSAGASQQTAEHIPFSRINSQVRGSCPGEEVHVWITGQVP